MHRGFFIYSHGSMKRVTLLNAIYFLQRCVPRGQQEQEQLLQTVHDLQTELSKKDQPKNKL